MGVGYHSAMLDNADKPDPDLVYRHYLETCRRLGVTPTPQDRGTALIREWTEALAAGRADEPPATH